jgi:dolichol-phosphate mannosyltransferase
VTSRLQLAWTWGKARVTAGGRFLVVGLLGIGVNQLLLWLIVEMAGIHYLVAAILASQGSTAFNFAGVESWVFRGAWKPGIVKRFLSFDVLNSLSLVLRLPILAVLTSELHLHYLLSNLLAIGVLTAVRFVVADRVIWKAPVPAAALDPLARSQGSA